MNAVFAILFIQGCSAPSTMSGTTNWRPGCPGKSPPAMNRGCMRFGRPSIACCSSAWPGYGFLYRSLQNATADLAGGHQVQESPAACKVQSTAA
jgi:hypothetical protein